MIHDARFNAFREAIQNAKSEYVKFLGETIKTSVVVSVKENTMPGTSDMGYPDRNMNFPVDLGETTAYNDADFVNEYGYPLTASLVNTSALARNGLPCT